MKVKDLLKLDPERDLMFVSDWKLRPVQWAEAPEGEEYALLLGPVTPKTHHRLTRQESEFIIGALSYGLSEESIASVLGRSVESIKRKRKSVGFSRGETA
jgi:DNA-binding NarL/FixJ family response regulator